MIHIHDHLRVAVLPLDIQKGDKDANIRAVAAAFEQLPDGTDIVVLPELFSTGFSNVADNLKDWAERNTESTIDFIKSLAARYSTAIAGSFLASTPPHIYNRAFFIEPSGEETYYDKRHLFSQSAETTLLHPGEQRMPIVRFRGWDISMIICYDLRFPVWCRTRHNDYELLLVPANWPDARRYAYEHLLIARAIENQCCVVGANRGGSDAFGNYDNMALIFNEQGLPVDYRIDNCPFVIADLSHKKLADYRNNFPVANDADDFYLIR